MENRSLRFLTVTMGVMLSFYETESTRLFFEATPSCQLAPNAAPASVLFTHEPDFHSTFGVDVPCITVLFARSSTFMTRHVDVEIHMSDDPADNPTTEGAG